MSAIYCVPSHRVVPAENMQGFLAEVDYSRRELGQPLTFMFFDDCTGPENAAVLRQTLADFPGLEGYYFDREDCNAVVDAITERLSKKQQLSAAALRLTKDEVNYGNTMNKLFLFALMFGADAIHRRDMDVLPPINNTTGEPLYAIGAETRRLGRKHAGRTAFIVGGGYHGKFNLDIQLLGADRDFDRLKRLFALLSIPESHHDAMIANDYVACNRDLVEETIVYDAGTYPECGNFSIFRLFELLPCAPVPGALGTDYFPTEIASNSGLYVASHNRAVRHRHTSCRYDTPSKNLTYWRGLAQLIDLQVFYRAYYDTSIGHRIDAQMLPGVELSIASDLAELVPWFRRQTEQRRARLNDYFSLLAQSQVHGVEELVRVLAADLDNLLELSQQAVAAHLDLLRVWGSVAAVARELLNDRDMRHRVSRRSWSQRRQEWP